MPWESTTWNRLRGSPLPRIGLTVVFLENGHFPDVIILDLALGSDSGFELLRTKRLLRNDKKIKIVVWSRMADRNRDFCELFKVDAYVSKRQGAAALQDALRQLTVH
jgi:CheY-like chemotaxis protein